MALKISKTINVNGDSIEYPCYTKISDFYGNKDRIYLNIEHRRFDKQEIIIMNETDSYTPENTETSLNYLIQGYGYLKKQEGYENAIDC